MSKAFYNCDTHAPSSTLLCASNPKRPPYFEVRDDNGLQPNNTHNGSQKPMGECHAHGWLLCGWSHYHSITQSDNQHCLRERQLLPCHNQVIPHCTCMDFMKMSSHSLGQRGKQVNYKHLYCVFRFYYIRWTTIMTSSFTLQHSLTVPATSCTCRCCGV